MKLNQRLFPILNRKRSPEHIACDNPAQAYFSQKVVSGNSSKKLSKQKSSEDRSILASSPRKLLQHHRSPPKKNATQLNVATVRGGCSNAKSNKSLRIYRRSLTDTGYRLPSSGRGRGAKRQPPNRSNMHCCDAWSSDTLSTFD